MGEADTRSPIWVGHVFLEVAKFRDSYKFFSLLGMRRVARMPGLAVLELRGGTHLVLKKGKAKEPTPADFDLMVDNLAAQRKALAAAGYAPSPIRRSRVHRSFKVAEPSGHTITFYDSHVAGPV